MFRQWQVSGLRSFPLKKLCTLVFRLPTMTQVPPSPMILVEDEKNPKNCEAKEEAGVSISDVSGGHNENAGSSDGDDALKLAGTQARHFDEKYYLRLRRKIVSQAQTQACAGC